MEKYHKQDVAPIEKENERDENYKSDNPQIDSERTRNNYRFTPYFGKTYTEFINGRIKELGLSPRKDAVVMNSFVLGSDKTFFDGLAKIEQYNFFSDCYKFFAKRYGEENIIAAIVHKPYFWHRSTVYKILRNPNYIGHLVNFKTTRKSYKNKRFIYRDPSEWKIIENHHEAIVDKETFDLAQKLTQVKRVVKNHFDDINIFAGLLYCADCGFPITLRRVAKNRNYDFYVCSKYNRRTKIQCTAHSILKRVLNELVLEDIKRVLKDVKTHESEFIEKYRKCSVKEMRSVRISAQTKITKAENRIKTLDDIIANLYEDNVTGKISDERFDLLAKKYEAEQTALKSEIVELNKALDRVNDEESNIREFLKVVNSYTEIEELTPEILNNFIDRIYIGEKYSDGSAHKQEIRIIYKFIGAESTHRYKVKGSRVAEIF